MLSSCINRLSRLSIGNQGGVVTRSFFASSGSPVGALATTATNRSCLSGNNSYTNNQQQQQPPPQQLQTRSKHSERQIKRLFRQHPAKIRVEASIGLDRTPEPLDPPQFKPVFEPTFLPNGWSAPPGTDVSIPEYPFQVKRTKNKPSDAIGFLPVYSNFR
mgnify:CR=1 FL=1